MTIGVRYGMEWMLGSHCFLFLTIGHLREPSDEKDFCEGVNFGRLFFLHGSSEPDTSIQQHERQSKVTT